MAYGYCGTEAKFRTWLQSALRRISIKHPSRIALIQKRRISLKTGSNNRMVYHFRCEHCKKLFKMRDCEVNHKKACGGLKDLSNLDNFIKNLLLVHESDLELLCHDCHGVVSYIEKYGVSRRDAVIEKKVLAFSKLPESQQVYKCKQAKINPVPKTKIGRKNAVREYLKENLPNDH